MENKMDRIEVEKDTINIYTRDVIFNYAEFKGMSFSARLLYDMLQPTDKGIDELNRQDGDIFQSINPEVIAKFRKLQGLENQTLENEVTFYGYMRELIDHGLVFYFNQKLVVIDIFFLVNSYTIEGLSLDNIKAIVNLKQMEAYQAAGQKAMEKLYKGKPEQ